VPLDNLIFPEPFKLSNRNPRGLSEHAQRAAITNFQVAVFESATRATNKCVLLFCRPERYCCGTSAANMAKLVTKHGQCRLTRARIREFVGGPHPGNTDM
jgi:hypothetical protein